jgi:rhodanese-related sulfurtransferase
LFSQTVEKLLASKGLSKADKVILMCRSGDRSAVAANSLAAAGFTQVYSQIEGFEGDMSPEGRRTVNGWKNAGLPWTYRLDKARVYFSRN